MQVLTLVRKCKISHCFPCGANGPGAGGLTITWLTKFISWMDRQPNFLSHGAPLYHSQPSKHRPHARPWISNGNMVSKKYLTSINSDNCDLYLPGSFSRFKKLLNRKYLLFISSIKFWTNFGKSLIQSLTTSSTVVPSFCASLSAWSPRVRTKIIYEKASFPKSVCIIFRAWASSSVNLSSNLATRRKPSNPLGAIAKIRDTSWRTSFCFFVFSEE